MTPSTSERRRPRIVIIGANGQVGAEVTLLLANTPGVELRPVARSRAGSAFLRYHGVRVMHGSISNPSDAKRLLEGADVIANFALALGTPAQQSADNTSIIAQTFEAAPNGATVVFFSTLAVLGRYDTSRGRQNTMYAKLKLDNEEQVLAEATRTGRAAYVLRLGHVAGPYQNITQSWRSEILQGAVAVADPGRASNVTFTATIADALLAIGEHRAGPAGRYDLVNVPQWTWAEIYADAAGAISAPLRLEMTPPVARLARRTGHASLKSVMLAAINRLGLKEQAARLAAELPASLNDSVKADHFVNRARAEIALLTRHDAVASGAQLWPALAITALDGLQPTRELVPRMRALERAGPPAHRWPPDL